MAQEPEEYNGPSKKEIKKQQKAAREASKWTCPNCGNRMFKKQAEYLQVETGQIILALILIPVFGIGLILLLFAFLGRRQITPAKKVCTSCNYETQHRETNPIFIAILIFFFIMFFFCIIGNALNCSNNVATTTPTPSQEVEALSQDVKAPSQEVEKQPVSKNEFDGQYKIVKRTSDTYPDGSSITRLLVYTENLDPFFIIRLNEHLYKAVKMNNRKGRMNATYFNYLPSQYWLNSGGTFIHSGPKIINGKEVDPTVDQVMATITYGTTVSDGIYYNDWGLYFGGNSNLFFIVDNDGSKNMENIRKIKKAMSEAQQ